MSGEPSREGAGGDATLAEGVVTRFVALLRTSRSYPIGHATLRRQIEQLHASIALLLRAHPEARLTEREGDLHLNGARWPVRDRALRTHERLAQEFAARGIVGVAFARGLRQSELEEFLRLFFAGESFKGDELAAACVAHGVTRIAPVVREAAAAPAAAPASHLPPALAGAFAAGDAAIAGARPLLDGDALARGVELRHVRRLVQPLIEQGERGGALVAGLIEAGLDDGATAHGVHVTLVAIGLGAALGLDRRALAELGVAALLHDCGQRRVEAPGRPPESWTDAERRQAARHALEGARRIAAATTLNTTSLAAMRAALEHHALGADAPFPTRRAAAALSQAVAIADAFVTLLGEGAPARRRTPSEALALVLGPLAGRFPLALRAALVRAVGVHPPGQVVRLDDGAIARALAPTAEPERPWVEMLVTPAGVRLPEGRRPVGELAPERRVALALPLGEWPDLGDSAKAA